MVYLGKLELCSVILISLVAYSVGSQNSIDDLHNQLNDNQQKLDKRASGFVPMRGRKNDDNEFSNSNIDHSSDNEKESIVESNNFDLAKTLNNLFKINNDGNLEEQLNLLDQSNFPYRQATSNGQLNLHHSGFEPFRKYPIYNRLYGTNQITPFLMSRYGTPKRAGFVPMRGRKNDPNVLLTNYEDEDFSPYSFKRAGFLPMRGKKASIDLDDLNSINQKRAFHALRG